VSDSHESARSAALTIKHVVPIGRDRALCGTPILPPGRPGSDPCVVCTALLLTTAEADRSLNSVSGGSRITATRYANSPAATRPASSPDDRAHRLFPAPRTQTGTFSGRSLVFHVRCSECRAVNDVPSLPTICYLCGCPLAVGRC
jgi:hypothetical protein